MSGFIIKDGVLEKYKGNEECVVIPDSVTSIGFDAFEGCTQLKSVVIHDSVTIIKSYAFANCSALENITIPRSVKEIMYCAFEGCSSLRSVYISDIAAWCGIKFGDCDANPLGFDCNLFLNGELVTELVIPEGVEIIENIAFEYCRFFTSIRIPDSVTIIRNNAFRDCIYLKEIHITNIAAWIAIEFEDSDSNPLHNAHNLYLNGELLTELVIPDGITHIKDYTFDNCTSLQRVVFPDSVTSIGRSAFSHCDSLTDINIPDSVTSIGSDAFCECYCLKSVLIPNPVTSIEWGVFSNCDSLTDVNIPDSITDIKMFAFANCSALESITIPRSVKKISSGAFVWCKKLNSVNIPPSVRLIGSDAFKGCSSLSSVYISDIAAWCGIEFSNDLSNPLAFDCDLFLNGEPVREHVIPDGVETISENAFNNCRSLVSVSIPESVTVIGKNAFANCENLKTVEIKGCNTCIDDEAFKNCHSLISVTIPESSHAVISSSAFNNRSSMTAFSVQYLKYLYLWTICAEEESELTVQFDGHPVFLRSVLYSKKDIDRIVAQAEQWQIKYVRVKDINDPYFFTQESYNDITNNQIVVKDGNFAGVIHDIYRENILSYESENSRIVIVGIINSDCTDSVKYERYLFPRGSDGRAGYGEVSYYLCKKRKNK